MTAPWRRTLRALRYVHLVVAGGAHDDRAGADHVRLSDLDVVAQRGVDADEAVRADAGVSGHDHLRRQEAVVADRRVVADVVAAPQHHVAAQPDEGLHDVALEDEAVLAQLDVPCVVVDELNQVLAA